MNWVPIKDSALYNDPRYVAQITSALADHLSVNTASVVRSYIDIDRIVYVCDFTEKFGQSRRFTPDEYEKTMSRCEITFDVPAYTTTTFINVNWLYYGTGTACLAFA